MHHDTAANSPPAWDTLRQFARHRPATSDRGFIAAEPCELCSEPLRDAHAHLVEPATRRIVCACDACALLFDEGRQAHARYRRVPRDVRSLPTLDLTDADWAELRIPIGLVFFFHSSVADRVVAVYPSPAGPTESLIKLDAWASFAGRSEPLQRMQPDVEALLVNRTAERRDGYLVPIDLCYQLVGLIRTRWRGLSGGREGREAIEQFFVQLAERAR